MGIVAKAIEWYQQRKEDQLFRQSKAWPNPDPRSETHQGIVGWHDGRNPDAEPISRHPSYQRSFEMGRLDFELKAAAGEHAIMRQQFAREDAAREADARFQSDLFQDVPEAEQEDWEDDTLRERLQYVSTPTIDRIAEAAIQRMIERVPLLQAEALLDRANTMEAEAAIEGGWDNYSTAASLRSQADTYRVAAAVRDAEAPVGSLMVARTQLVGRILDQVTLETDDEDVGEDTHSRRSRLDHAIGDLNQDDRHTIIAELSVSGHITEAEAMNLHTATEAEQMRGDLGPQVDLERDGAEASPAEWRDHDDDMGH